MLINPYGEILRGLLRCCQAEYRPLPRRSPKALDSDFRGTYDAARGRGTSVLPYFREGYHGKTSRFHPSRHGRSGHGELRPEFQGHIHDDLRYDQADPGPQPDRCRSGHRYPVELHGGGFPDQREDRRGHRHGHVPGAGGDLAVRGFVRGLPFDLHAHRDEPGWGGLVPVPRVHPGRRRGESVRRARSASGPTRRRRRPSPEVRARHPRLPGHPVLLPPLPLRPDRRAAGTS